MITTTYTCDKCKEEFSEKGVENFTLNGPAYRRVQIQLCKDCVIAIVGKGENKKEVERSLNEQLLDIFERVVEQEVEDQIGNQ